MLPGEDEIGGRVNELGGRVDSRDLVTLHLVAVLTQDLPEKIPEDVPNRIPERIAVIRKAG